MPRKIHEQNTFYMVFGLKMGGIIISVARCVQPAHLDDTADPPSLYYLHINFLACI